MAAIRSLSRARGRPSGQVGGERLAVGAATSGACHRPAHFRPAPGERFIELLIAATIAAAADDDDGEPYLDGHEPVGRN